MHSRARKVEKIFRQFDRNADGRLSRDEMAALVIAVNPRVKFSDEQIRAILDEVFRTYGEFIDGDRGLSLDGLLRTYDDGAGDVDRDFDALGLQLEDAATDADSSFGDESRAESGDQAAPAVPASIVDERPDAARRRQNVGPWASSPTNGIVYDDTWRIVEDLEIVLRRAESKVEARRRARKKASGGGGGQARSLHELGSESAGFLKEVGQLRQRADASRTQEEAFDAHMAMGRSLSDHRFYEEALVSFKRATELKPSDVRPHFRAGNTLYSLSRPAEARAAYELALEASQSGSQQWVALAPQVHVNLGIALEAQGMLLSACEHYREAAILHPSHYRALKLLGSALLGVAEYRAAEKALGEAVFLRPDYADAHCDLGSALHALGDHERAAAEFQRAIDLEPAHVDALYNLAGLLLDTGSFQQAADMYARVLVLRPGHWRAQLNRAVSLLGAGDTEGARQALKEALRMTSRLEVYDAIGQLKLLRRLNSPAQAAVVHDASRFTRASASTTPRQWMAQALAVRAFQRQTGLHRCAVINLASEMESGRQLPLSQAAGGVSEKLIRKADLESSLWRLLDGAGAGPSAFASAVKAVNERVLGALDRSGSGRIDFGMFLASLAPVCAGLAERRKQVAFDCLVWRSSRSSRAQVVRSDAKAYLRQLRAVYMPSEGASTLWEIHGDDESSTLSYPEFVAMFDDPEWGFAILPTLIRLESGGDRVRHAGVACAVCASYPITGPRFKEVQLGFNLCAMCYSEGKVPASKQQQQQSYSFREYTNRGEAVKDRLLRFRSLPLPPPAPVPEQPAS